MVNMQNILDDILAFKNGADKSMRGDMASNSGILNPTQYNQFLRDIEINSTILKDAAFKKMNNHTEVTSGVKVLGRVLQDGYLEEPTGHDRKTNNNLKEAQFGFGKAELNAKKLKAKCSLLDDDVEDNIEREQFQATVLSMMASAIGEDLEAIALFGDTTLGYEDEPLFHTYDGWIKQATVSLKSSELASTNKEKAFDVHENTIEAMFDAIIRAVPLRLRQSPLMNRFTIYVPFEVEDAYRNLLKSRNTQLGDNAQTSGAPLPYKRFQIKYAPVLDAEDGRALDDTVTCIGGLPDYWRWGVYKEVKLEPDRVPGDERTDFYYRTRCDVGLEWNASLISAKLTAAEALVIQDEAKA